MTARPTIVIADRGNGDLPDYAHEIARHFQCNFEYVTSESDLDAVITEIPAEILLIDAQFPCRHDAFRLMVQIKAKHPHLLILPVIPADNPDLVKKTLQLELFHFIYRPLNPLEASMALKRAYETRQQSSPREAALSQAPERTNFHGMIGRSEVMRQLFDLVSRVAEDDMSTVLIRGESGTGKEMIAKAIHAESSRKNNNFVPVNCAAIPDDLLESELFGYTKGAFTGATSNKPGRIQYADQGTLFLDEIGDMKGSLQAKLLRVLQEREFEPVGAFKAIPVDTRILAATHCDLERLVSEGKFREDLYYRLSVIPIHIPKLTSRLEDLPHLIDAFQEKYADQRGRPRCSFSSRAMAVLMHYDWRGNVRELENFIQQMSILYAGRKIDIDALPEKFASVEIPEEERYAASDDTFGKKKTPGSHGTSGFFTEVPWENGEIHFNSLINDIETRLIVAAMKKAEGNKKEAARLLNLKRTTLLEKIKKKDIDGLWEK